jgi:hypothetical protein
VDAQTNYYEGPTAMATNTGRPRLLINEFDVFGNTSETIEIYNPSLVPLNIGGCILSDEDVPNEGHRFYVPPNTTIAARGVWATNSSAWTNRFSFSDAGTENIYLAWSDEARLDEWNMKAPQSGITQGRAWDGGPRGFQTISNDFESCEFRPGSSYPPTLSALNHPQRRKFLDAAPSLDPTVNYLAWQDIGRRPATWRYSPKQHDNHPINVEDIAFRSANEVIIGLRAPLAHRTSGHAYFFVVTNVALFLGTRPWPAASQLQGIAGPYQMDLGGLGIRSLKWCPNGLTNAQGAAVQRYLIVAGLANGGPLQREERRQKFSLFAWDGTWPNNLATPQRLIDDLEPYTVRPEGVDLIRVDGEWRVLFVEDRLEARGYGTHNAIHWPVRILGTPQ